MWGLPILVALGQTALLLTVFKFDTPTALKQNGNLATLRHLMYKIYPSCEVDIRIDAIVTDTVLNSDL